MNVIPHPAATAYRAEAPRLIERMRRAIRIRHYPLRTVEVFLGWIRRFFAFTRRHPGELSSDDVNRFLTDVKTALIHTPILNMCGGRGIPSPADTLNDLARTVHELSAAAGDASAPGALSLPGVLNISTRTPPRPKVSMPARHRRLVDHATRPHASFGLVQECLPAS